MKIANYVRLNNLGEFKHAKMKEVTLGKISKDEWEFIKVKLSRGTTQVEGR